MVLTKLFRLSPKNVQRQRHKLTQEISGTESKAQTFINGHLSLPTNSEQKLRAQSQWSVIG